MWKGKKIRKRKVSRNYVSFEDVALLVRDQINKIAEINQRIKAEENYLVMNVSEGVWVDLVKAKSMIKGNDYDNQGQYWIRMPKTTINISKDMYDMIKNSKEKGEMWRTSFSIE